MRLSAMVTGFCNTTLGSSGEIGGGGRGWRAAVEAGGCPQSPAPGRSGPGSGALQLPGSHMPHEVGTPQEVARPASLCRHLCPLYGIHRRGFEPAPTHRAREDRPGRTFNTPPPIPFTRLGRRPRSR